MSDMLIKLYNLSHYQTSPAADMERRGIDIRRALTPEKHVIVPWVLRHFSAHWASECEAAFCSRPVSCFIAALKGEMAGFCCHDVTCKGFVGPIGVSSYERGQGIGKALLMASLNDMVHQGYAYAVVGDAGPEKFFSTAAGASIIEGSEPGIYRGMFKGNKTD